MHIQARTVLCAVALTFAATCALAQTAPPGVDPKADDILRKMGQTLAQARQFTFEADDMTDQMLEDGQKIQVSKTVKVAVRRPDHIAAEVSGDDEELRYAYSGDELTIVNLREKCYAQQKVPANIDEMFDFLAMKYGLTPPLADLMFAEPYKAMTERLRTGRYLGVHQVMGVKCHHLAFRQDGIDWQIWIEDSARPVPRKVVITYKELPGYPQFIALLSKWNLEAQIPDSAFELQAPSEYRRIDLVPVAREANPAPGR